MRPYASIGQRLEIVRREVRGGGEEEEEEMAEREGD